MSKFFTLCKTNKKKHGLHDQPMNFNKAPKRNSNGSGALGFLIFLIVVSSVFYVFQITSSATAGFEITEKQEKIKELKLQNEKIKNKLSYLEDLNSLQVKADQLGMVQAGEIEYLDLSDIGMAMK